MNAPFVPDPTALRLTHHYPFPREAVFRAWTEPEALKAWFGPKDEFRVPIVEIDLRVGGRYRIVAVNPSGEEHEGGGVYTEVSAPSRLSFTWRWSFTQGQESLVTVEFRDADCGTELVLTHERLADNVRTAHRDGWAGSLERLRRHLESSARA